MNRDLKFRAWYNSKFYYNIEKHHCNFGDIWDFSDWLKYAEVQQYVGLKDKFGRDIYVGDIIDLRERGITGNPSTVKSICEVFVKYPVNGCWFFHARPLPVENKGRQFSLYDTECEIIGNIFENPELLN